jgi:hypothetical protein
MIIAALMMLENEHDHASRYAAVLLALFVTVPFGWRWRAMLTSLFLVCLLYKQRVHERPCVRDPLEKANPMSAKMLSIAFILLASASHAQTKRTPIVAEAKVQSALAGMVRASDKAFVKTWTEASDELVNLGITADQVKKLLDGVGRLNH